MNDETDYAFPHQYKSAPDQLTVCLGMTLRDYFAAKAMQGIVANPNAQGLSYEAISMRAFAQADSMLKAREA